MVAFNGVGNSFWAWPLHVFRHADYIGCFSSPVAALPKRAVGTPRDDCWIPFGTAHIGVVIVCVQADVGIERLARVDQVHQSVIATHAVVDFVFRRIASILSVVRPSPTESNLRGVVSEYCNIVNHLLRLGERRSWLFFELVLAASQVKQFVIKIMRWDGRHTLTYQLRTI